jgi:Domain of unknown function (DUF1844)
MEPSEGADLTFAGFVISLATTAAMHFGDIPDPTTGQRSEPDLPRAAGVIQLLEMLQQKTRGNLIPEEERVLDDVLYELRMRFVQAHQGERRIVQP